MNSKKFLEKDLETYFFNHPEYLGMEKWIHRQFEFPVGKIDLLGIDTNKIFSIVELKNVSPVMKDIGQILKYQMGLSLSLAMIDSTLNTSYVNNIRMMLVFVGKAQLDVRMAAAAAGIDLYSINMEKQIMTEVIPNDIYDSETIEIYRFIAEKCLLKYCE